MLTKVSANEIKHQTYKVYSKGTAKVCVHAWL